MTTLTTFYPEAGGHDYDSALELTGYSSFHYWYGGTDGRTDGRTDIR